MLTCLLLACTTEIPTPSPVATPAAPTLTPAVTPVDDEPPTATPPSTPGSLPSPGPGEGFAFPAEDVLAYYEGLGYECTDSQLSRLADGFSFRNCSIVDDDGRTRVIGLVVDPDGELANGFASVEAAEGETTLAPIDALEPLAGFLGAMVGAERGSAILTWLATHLGDEYAETTDGELRIATYAETEEALRLYVEMANQEYLDAPAVEGN